MKLLTRSEVAAILRVSPRRVSQYVEEGALTSVRSNGRWRLIPKTSLDAFILQRCSNVDLQELEDRLVDAASHLSREARKRLIIRLQVQQTQASAYNN